MGSQIERELSAMRLRFFLLEKFFWDFYMRVAPTTVAQSRQTASTLATQLLEQLHSRIENEFRTSELWKHFHLGSAETAVKQLREQIDEMKKSVPVA